MPEKFNDVGDVTTAGVGLGDGVAVGVETGAPLATAVDVTVGAAEGVAVDAIADGVAVGVMSPPKGDGVFDAAEVGVEVTFDAGVLDGAFEPPPLHAHTQAKAKTVTAKESHRDNKSVVS